MEPVQEDAALCQCTQAKNRVGLEVLVSAHPTESGTGLRDGGVRVRSSCLSLPTLVAPPHAPLPRAPEDPEGRSERAAWSILPMSYVAWYLVADWLVGACDCPS